MQSLFHGTVGYLDELLALGIVLAIGVIIYFVFALIESRSRSAEDKHEET
jgi:predicted exporter